VPSENGSQGNAAPVFTAISLIMTFAGCAAIFRSPSLPGGFSDVILFYFSILIWTVINIIAMLIAAVRPGTRWRIVRFARHGRYVAPHVLRSFPSG
jgi:hypothetical protein